MTKMLKVVLSLAIVLGGLPALAETDLALSGYGAYTQKTSTSTVIQHPASQGGYLVELRHISNPLVGYEVNYGFNRANQTYSTTSQVCSVTGCSSRSAAVPADAHEVTADWVVSLKIAVFRPFVLAGGGVLVTVPQGATLKTTVCGSVCTTSSIATTARNDTKGMFNYGAGVDWTVVPHLGLRLQYRGRVSKAPDLVTAFSSTDKFTRTSEPVFGAFLSF